MQAQVKWAQDMQFIGESGTGHKVHMDGPEEAGGKNMGMRPMELLLLGLGGCTSFDVMQILRKARQDVHDCVVSIDSERSDEIPKVFTKIHVHFTISGKELSEKRVKRAIELSADKYCSASLMLAKTAEITHDYEIIEID